MYVHLALRYAPPTIPNMDLMLALSTNCDIVRNFFFSFLKLENHRGPGDRVY